jgi:hypothetical protein
LLRNLLDAHRSLAVPPEANWLVPSLRAWLPSRDGDLAALWHLIRAHPAYQRWAVDDGLVADRVATHAPDSPGALIGCVYAAWADSRGKALVADKTPEHVRHIPFLADLFPATTFVHLVRDPRDVVQSLSLMWWTRDGVAEAAQLWALSAGAAAAAADVLANRVQVVRYEDLVSSPATVVGRLVALAGLPPDDDVVVRYRERPAVQHHTRRAVEPIRADVRRWREDLSRADRAIVEAAAGPLLSTFGYEASLGGLHPGARVKLATSGLATRLRWRARHRWGFTPPVLPARLPPLPRAAPLRALPR